MSLTITQVQHTKPQNKSIRLFDGRGLYTKLNIGAELLASVREMKADKGAYVHRVPVSRGRSNTIRPR